METEREGLIRFCRGMGAPSNRAALMADRLLKRAEQLSVQRGISREAALEYLLQVMVHGRRGEVYEGGASGGGKSDGIE